MSEVVYVIRLKKDQKNCGEETYYGLKPPYDYQISRHGISSANTQDVVLPSEQRYTKFMNLKFLRA